MDCVCAFPLVVTKFELAKWFDSLLALQIVNYFQLLCLLQIAVSVNGPVELSEGPEHLCMCYRRYWDLGYVSPTCLECLSI